MTITSTTRLPTSGAPYDAAQQDAIRRGRVAQSLRETVFHRALPAESRGIRERAEGCTSRLQHVPCVEKVEGRQCRS